MDDTVTRLLAILDRELTMDAIKAMDTVTRLKLAALLEYHLASLTSDNPFFEPQETTPT